MARSANVSVNRVQVVWTGTPVAGGGLSTFYFQTAFGTPAQQVTAVATFLQATEDQRSNALAWATQADVAQLNETTGALENITSTTQVTGVGLVSGEPLPFATQGLLRLLSNQIGGSRLIRGRMFLPGTMEAQQTAGIPLAAYRTDYDTAAAALIADTNTVWAIWSRTHGQAVAVMTANVWTKWAILRSRRD